MSLLNYFRADPSRDWPPCGGSRPIVFSVHDGSLEGVHFGSPIADLKRFGRPSNKAPARTSTYGFAPLGLEVVARAGRVSHFTCVFNPKVNDTEIDGLPDYAACRLLLGMPDASEVRVSRSSTFDDLVDWLGLSLEPLPNGDQIYAARIGRVWIGCDFDEDGRIAFVDLEQPSAA
jgi:hypothetical protein